MLDDTQTKGFYRCKSTKALPTPFDRLAYAEIVGGESDHAQSRQCQTNRVVVLPSALQKSSRSLVCVRDSIITILYETIKFGWRDEMIKWGGTATRGARILRSEAN